MKKFVQTITFSLAFSLFFATLGFAQFQVTESNGGTANLDGDKAEWIHWDDGDNANAIGLADIVTWHGFIRFETTDLAAYDGMTLSKVRTFLNDEPTYAAVVVWTGAQGDFTEVVNQEFIPAEAAWVDVDLTNPVVIDASVELWIGIAIGDPGDGFFPLGCDVATDADGKGNLATFDEGANFDALSDYGIDGDWNIQGFVESSGETYAVTFNVIDEADAAINNATITVGTTTNPEGDYVFDLTSGTHAYTVMAPGYSTVEDELIVEDAPLEVTVVMVEAPTVPVTFNVDMTDAVIGEGDEQIVFDPLIHDVYISGDFNIWAEPGSDENYKLLPVPEKNQKTETRQEYLFPGNWENRTDEILGQWTDAGYIFGLNDYNDGAYGQIFENSEEYEITAAKYWIGDVAGTTGDAVFTIWDYSGDVVGDVLAEKTIALADIMPSDNFDDAFVVTFDEPIIVTGSFVLGVNLTQLDTWVEGTYTLGNVHSNFGDGDAAGLAIVLEGDTWVPVLNYDVDVDIAVFPLVNTVEPQGSIYTITLNAEEGETEYKYFLVEDNIPNGDLGEWDGDPNRSVEIADGAVFDDIWGDKPGTFVNSISEDGFSVYPNPARDNMNIVSDSQINELRIFDLSGKLVFSQSFNTNHAMVNVSDFNTGLYIMQVATDNGTNNLKFSVIK